MNWKKCAEQDLRNYNRTLEAQASLDEKIAMLESKIGVKAMSMSEPVMGGTSKVEDKILNNMVERERLKFNLDTVNTLVKITERGLSALNTEERTVVDAFYINDIDCALSELCGIMNISKSQVYRIRDSALYKFTISCYGILDL